MVDHLGDDPSPVFVLCGFSTPCVQRGPVDLLFCSTGPHARRAAHIASLLFLSFLRSTMCYLVLARPVRFERTMLAREINNLLSFPVPLRSIISKQCFFLSPTCLLSTP